MNTLLFSGEVLASKEAFGQFGNDRYLNFQVQHTDSYRGKDGEIKTKYVKMRCSYKPLGDHEHIEVGDIVYVEGEMETKADKTNSGTTFFTSVRVKNYQRLIEAKNRVQATKVNHPAPQYQQNDLDF